MPDQKPDYPDPRTEDIVYGDRRISRPDSSLPDWEVPDTAYRPIPIVWFTGALFAHLIAGSLILVVTPNAYPVVEVALCAMAAAFIARWTWDRGMHSAGSGWKFATIAMLAFVTLFFIAIAFS